MVHKIYYSLFTLALVLVPAIVTQGGIMEVGDLNVISDVGNPSDGLRFLDMSYSINKTSAQAVANAQTVYADARLATPAEWDDLIDAAGITYSGALTASDAFSTGGTFTISSFGTYDSGALAAKLGYTVSNVTIIFSDPDGNSSSATTRDYMWLGTVQLDLFQAGALPPHSQIGWLIVSESDAVVVPEPSSIVLTGLGGFFLIAGRRRFRRVPC